MFSGEIPKQTMRRLKNYLPITLFIPYIIYSSFDNKPGTLNVIIYFIVIVFVFAFFEILDRTRENRVDKWDSVKSTKVSFGLRYGLIFGLPLSIIFTLSLVQMTSIIILIFLVIIPITLLFVWLGINEWNQCYKLFLENKYSTRL